MRLVSTTHIAQRYGVTKEAVHSWRRRNPNFPAPRETQPYPRYDMDDIERWYAIKWPNRSKQVPVFIHRYRIDHGGVKLTTTEFGPLPEARGYLHGIRDALFGGWRIYSTADGFSAHRGNEIEVWVIDPTTAEPEPWTHYDSLFKTAGRRQG